MASGRVATCPSCQRTFTEGELFCPYDRFPLPEVVIVQTDPLINAVVNGSYTVLERLGSGGMGVVYKALQHRLNRHVALKVLSPRFSDDPSAADRFRVEALAASQLANGHTVVVHDFGSMEDGMLYIAMQLLEGEGLRARLKRGPLPPRIAVTIALHISESLAEAHERPQPIIHRDIKPDNVFVRDVSHGNVHATVLDFGLARFADSQQMRLTSVNVAIGTPAYMSPEQCRAQNLDARADLYSLGVVLFEMLAGHPPFEASDPASLLFKHVYDPPPRPVEIHSGLDIPEQLEALLFELLAKSPADRPPSAAATRDRLQDILDLLPRQVPVPAPGGDQPTLGTQPVFESAPRTTAETAQPDAREPTLGAGLTDSAATAPPSSPAWAGRPPLRRPIAAFVLMAAAALALVVTLTVVSFRPKPNDSLAAAAGSAAAAPGQALNVRPLPRPDPPAPAALLAITASSSGSNQPNAADTHSQAAVPPAAEPASPSAQPASSALSLAAVPPAAEPARPAAAPRGATPATVPAQSTASRRNERRTRQKRPKEQTGSRQSNSNPWDFN